MKKIFQEEESIKILKILGLINNIPEYRINQEFRLKKIDGIKNYLIEEISQNELMSTKDKKVCRVLNYIKNSLIAIFTITCCVSISVFLSLVGIPMGIVSSTIGLKICVITAGSKKYRSIIKEKRKEHDKIVLLAKSKLTNIEVIVSKVSINSLIGYNFKL